MKVDTGEYSYLDISLLESQAKISDLQKNTLYEIKVAGLSQDGIGPYSEEIREKTTTGKYLIFQLHQSHLLTAYKLTIVNWPGKSNTGHYFYRVRLK